MLDLLQRINHKSAPIGIIGLGYVGLPLALRFCEAGFRVLGFDADAGKLRALSDGKSYLRQYPHQRIADALAQGFTPEANISRIGECDAVILCLPTPLSALHTPDLSYIRQTMEVIVPHLRFGQLLSLESTTYPGTTEEEIVPRVVEAGLKVGEDIYISYAPEREDPGNEYPAVAIPKVVSGVTPMCCGIAEALYSHIVDKVVPVSSTRVAEMTKIIENTQRLVNIALMNEMKLICDHMAIDPFEVIHAAASKPFGFMPYYPGPGVGGHCIPVDPLYLAWKAKEYGLNTQFIALASEVNASMPGWVVAKTAKALLQHGLTLAESNVLIVGISYKSNVDDMRGSPAAEIIALLQENGANVRYCDPWIPSFPVMRGYQFSLESDLLSPQVLHDADAVILCTAHDAFDYGMIAAHARLIIDTRGKYPVGLPNVVRA